MRVLAIAGLALAVSVAATSCSPANDDGDAQPPRRSLDDLRGLTCPQVDHGEGASTDRRNPRARRVVVPTGAEAALLCRYFGLGRTQASQRREGRLESRRLLRRAPLVRLLAREFDESRPMHGAYACPATLEGHIVARFAYAGEPPVPVEASLSGCWTAYNGYGLGGWLAPRLARRLKRLTGP